jgi:hypothetical protein
LAALVLSPALDERTAVAQGVAQPANRPVPDRANEPAETEALQCLIEARRHGDSKGTAESQQTREVKTQTLAERERPVLYDDATAEQFEPTDKFCFGPRAPKNAAIAVRVLREKFQRSPEHISAVVCADAEAGEGGIALGDANASALVFRIREAAVFTVLAPRHEANCALAHEVPLELGVPEGVAGEITMAGQFLPCVFDQPNRDLL